ncbi:transposase [Streptomyces sp. TLI_053]|uniref:transposase n=1 Tax=Streptomyces sp. TLI_053 TaxID=1855352 RepID=UPI001E3F6CB9|nr:transposase [Streptomyces sp. TLI_053]
MRYLVAGGIAWRAMPADFPAWDRVHAFFRRWRDRGLFGEFHDRLRDRVRKTAGGDREQTAGIVDAQDPFGVGCEALPVGHGDAELAGAVQAGARGAQDRVAVEVPETVVGVGSEGFGVGAQNDGQVAGSWVGGMNSRAARAVRACRRTARSPLRVSWVIRA